MKEERKVLMKPISRMRREDGTLTLGNLELLHGGDYNPEQWLDRPDILKEDIRMMKKAKVNVVTLGVFAWSVLEPEEGSYQFDWLSDIMDRLYENGIYTILATPSGAKPVWIDEKYPEVLRVDEWGRRRHHGVLLRFIEKRWKKWIQGWQSILENIQGCFYGTFLTSWAEAAGVLFVRKIFRLIWKRNLMEILMR